MKQTIKQNNKLKLVSGTYKSKLDDHEEAIRGDDNYTSLGKIAMIALGVTIVLIVVMVKEWL